MLTHWFVALLALTITSSSAVAETFVVTLKVVDSRNQPVAKADAALFWDVTNGAMVPRADRGSVTNAAGKTGLTVDNCNEKRVIMVLSADRKLGAIVGVSKDDDGKELTVRLRQTVHVKGKLDCQELKRRPVWANTTVNREGFRPYFAQNISKAGALEFVLPPGTYTFRTYGSDVEAAEQTIVLGTDGSGHDLGTIDLKASPIAKLKGKTPPDLTITDARGVKRDMKLRDYKGKWLYIEFWGYW